MYWYCTWSNSPEATRGRHRAADLDGAATLETFVADPTEEKDLHQALCNLRTLIERLADD